MLRYKKSRQNGVIEVSIRCSPLFGESAFQRKIKTSIITPNDRYRRTNDDALFTDRTRSSSLLRSRIRRRIVDRPDNRESQIPGCVPERRRRKIEKLIGRVNGWDYRRVSLCNHLDVIRSLHLLATDSCTSWACASGVSYSSRFFVARSPREEIPLLYSCQKYFCLSDGGMVSSS